MSAVMTPAADLDAIADALVSGHTRRTFADLPGAPATFEEAYRVQAKVTERLGFAVAGWKVGITPDGTATAAPLYAPYVVPSGATRRADAGGLAIEAEIAVRLRHDLPPRPGRAYSRDEILAAVDHLLVGVEIVSGRMPLGGPPAPFLADNLGNGGYVCGDTAVVDPAIDLAALRCRVLVGDRVLHDAKGGHFAGDPLRPLEAYANAQSDGLGGLRAGQVVTTGTLCGLLTIAAPADLTVEVESIGRVVLRIVPAGSSDDFAI
jgi:2-keto-4-pentenoate hydratase